VICKVKFEIGKGFGGPACRTPTTASGCLTVGPERLLSWLESQLGLELPTISFTTRMVQYLTCLQQSDNPDRFYHESSKQDGSGVART